MDSYLDRMTRYTKVTILNTILYHSDPSHLVDYSGKWDYNPQGGTWAHIVTGLAWTYDHQAS